MSLTKPPSAKQKNPSLREIPNYQKKPDRAFFDNFNYTEPHAMDKI